LVILVPLAAVLPGFRVTKAGFLAGTAAGVAGVLIWNGLLKSAAGINGLVIGVLCNLIAFAVTNELSTDNAE
jgi:Na+/proline symporter